MVDIVIGHGLNLRGFPVKKKNGMSGCARLKWKAAHGCNHGFGQAVDGNGLGG